MEANSSDTLSVFFLAEGEQSAESIMARLTGFIAEAKESLDFAIYDMRFSDGLKARLTAALHERAAQGVRIRICFDGDKPIHPNPALGQDPATPGTSAAVESLGYPWRRIAGMKLMHHKFIVRDAAAVWTGSLNMTDDAFSLMENNVVQISSPRVAAYYARDFEQLWERENFENTGNIKTDVVPLRFAGQTAGVRVMFSPGTGLDIDEEVARRVRSAQRRVRICSLLVNSGTLIGALQSLLAAGRVKVDGIYDRTQMTDVYRQWREVPQNHWKVPALQEVIAQAGLIGKDSTPYSPTGRHDFMHNKILVIDDTVVTGSYNFSRSAQFNAENILFIESAGAAAEYSGYIDHLLEKYGDVARKK
jgi:phosphatidylserine/phosphatidylglycerophosphate/cardiolipin synthase-like enzyme